MSNEISDGLALCIAGQVSVGLMQGDDDPLVRARIALFAIGLMIRNAVPEDENVQATLDLADSGRIVSG